MDTLRELMNFSSFWSIWYWLAHVVTWSLASHFTMGVPYDMIQQANREKDEEGPWAQAVDALARAQIFRIRHYARHFGVALTAVTAFLLAVLVTMGFYSGIEMARALLVLFAPLVVIYLISIAFAARADRQGLHGAALRKLIGWQRFWNQIIGVLALFLAMVLAVWEAVRGVQPVWL